MPFNIPVEEDRSGEMLGQGLANAMMMYRQGRADRQYRAEHQQDRAHMLSAQSLDDAIRQENARHAGIVPGTAPQENLDITVPDGLPPSTDHLPFETAMQPHPQGLASALGDQFNRAGSVRAPSSAPTTPGAFSMAGGGFHSPLKEQMSSAQPMGGGAPGGDAGFQKRSMPGTDPGFQNRPQDGPSHTLHMTPSYQQLTPDYYSDSTAPGPVGAALALELSHRKTDAEIGELGARAQYYREHGDYYGQGGRPTGGTRMDQLHNRVTELVAKGLPLAEADRQARAEFGYQEPRPSTALPPTVRSARSAASASRLDASAYDRRAGGFEHQLNDPMTQQLTDTTATFPALRDSASKYRAKGDSARHAAGLYDQAANQGSGLAAVLPPSANFSGTRGGSSSAPGRPPVAGQGVTQQEGTPPAAPRYTRQQVDSLYHDAIRRGAPADKAKARRDQLMKAASP